MTTQDGTLSVSCIDYQLMRSSIDIPEGDLFTVMETWDDGSRIMKSMDTILEIEAVAAAQSKVMPGLYELLDFLKEHADVVKVGLVTRNTVESMEAFFDAVGDHKYKDVFDILMTREFPFVKPDKRCLLHFANEWNLPPSSLLMVGDSTEDVECGNAAGTASCLIRGGGNEIGSNAKRRPPTGSVPTFAIDSLHELKQRLQARDTPLGWPALTSEERKAYALSSISSSDDEDDTDNAAYHASEEDYEIALESSAPPEGSSFFDWLFDSGYVVPPSCSFPRINSSRRGHADNEHPGDRVLHLGCGDGALTKLLFSSGLFAVGADQDPREAQRRGLAVVTIPPSLQDPGLLRHIQNTPSIKAGEKFHAVVFLGNEGNMDIARSMWTTSALHAISHILMPKGKGVLLADILASSMHIASTDHPEHVIDSFATPAGLQLEQFTTFTEAGTLRHRIIVRTLD